MVKQDHRYEQDRLRQIIDRNRQVTWMMDAARSVIFLLVLIIQFLVSCFVFKENWRHLSCFIVVFSGIWNSDTDFLRYVSCFIFPQVFLKRRQQNSNPDLVIARNHSCPLYHSGIAARPLIFQPSSLSLFHVCCFRLQGISGFRFLLLDFGKSYGFHVVFQVAGHFRFQVSTSGFRKCVTGFAQYVSCFIFPKVC